MGRPNPSRETALLGANGAREILFFSDLLTTSKIANLAWLLIHTLL